MRIVDGSNHVEEIKQLIIEYTHSLGRDLNFQHLDEELNDLKEKYTGRNGALLAAIEDKRVVGCVAYHKLNESCCEMKRLYVLPTYRRYGIGKELVERILVEAHNAGYKEMVLDTIEPLQSAIRLYKECGFQRIAAYYDNPMEDVLYMGRFLCSEI